MRSLDTNKLISATRRCGCNVSVVEMKKNVIARSKQHKDEKLLNGHGDLSARLLCACQFVIDVGTFEWIYYEELFGEHGRVFLQSWLHKAQGQIYSLFL